MPAATAHAAISHDASGLRTFCDDRAAHVAADLYFLCAKQMTPIMIWPAFGAPLLIQIALSALDASCDCGCYDQP